MCFRSKKLFYLLLSTLFDHIHSSFGIGFIILNGKGVDTRTLQTFRSFCQSSDILISPTICDFTNKPISLLQKELDHFFFTINIWNASKSPDTWFKEVIIKKKFIQMFSLIIFNNQIWLNWFLDDCHLNYITIVFLKGIVPSTLNFAGVTIVLWWKRHRLWKIAQNPKPYSKFIENLTNLILSFPISPSTFFLIRMIKGIQE